MLLTPADLAERWHVSPDDIRRRRATGTGPAFIRLGHKTVRYNLADVVRFESDRLSI